MCDCHLQRHFPTTIGGIRFLVCCNCGKSSQVDLPTRMGEERAAWRFLVVAACFLVACILASALVAWLAQEVN